MYNEYTIEFISLITGKPKTINVFARNSDEALRKAYLVHFELHMFSPSHTVTVKRVKEPSK